jgi:isoleucyl-tRNA synthetase
MFTMADGLARLLAPILPVTSDELWRYLPSAGREESVHLAAFPSSVERLADEALEAEWTHLREIRDAVNKSLEAARQAKVIGTSLAARVQLTAGGEAAALLKRHEADLPMLFITSQVTLDGSGPDGVSVAVLRAEGEKCERCWRIVPERSSEARFAGLCLRCVDALEAGDDGREVA